MTDQDKYAGLLSEIGASVVFMGCLPELPGHNGSTMFLDDIEAERVAKSLDDARDAIKLLFADHARLVAENERLLVNSGHHESTVPKGLHALCNQGEDYIWRPAKEAVRIIESNIHYIRAITAIHEKEQNSAFETIKSCMAEIATLRSQIADMRAALQSFVDYDGMSDFSNVEIAIAYQNAIAEARMLLAEHRAIAPTSTQGGE